MTEALPVRDLIVLVADADMQHVLEALLEKRTADLGVRRVTSDLYRHPNRDPGCLNEAHDFLRPFARRYSHALVVFDREGSGMESSTRVEIEVRIEKQLSRNGWQDRAAVVVPDPELEAWVWVASGVLDRVLRWPKDAGHSIRGWLERESFVANGIVKPTRPKEAFAAALRMARRPRSAAIYRELSENLPIDGCLDEAFGKLRRVLSSWFPAGTS